MEFQYMHYRHETNQNRGATVAILMNGKTEGYALVSVSRCGPNDIFRKSIGRDISSGRIKAYLNGRPDLDRHIIEVKVDDPVNVKAIVHKHIEADMAEYMQS